MSPDPAPARPRRSPTRREDLLDAAEGLFLERGVGATAVADITDRAGVAKGTFYLYFSSKDQVVVALHERLADGMVELFADVAQRVGTEDFFALADHIVALTIDYWIDHRELYVALLASGGMLETPELYRTKDAQIVGLMEGAVAYGVQQGVVEVADPAHVAQFLYFGCQGVTHMALMSPDDEIDRDRVVSGCQTMVRRALVAGP